MTDEARMIYALILLVMVSSALFSRRIPMGQMVRYALAWIAIFSAGFVLFSFRGQFLSAWNEIKSELAPGGVEERGGIVRLRKAESGHFEADVQINGKVVRMLVDSGATVTSISSATASRLGMVVDRSGFPVAVETANGATQAWRATVDELKLGAIRRVDFPVQVSDTLGDSELLGMNFLSTLKSWRVEGDEMVLEP
jgi:aspartyl protease family protein